MNRVLIGITALVLVTLACMEQIATVTPTPAVSPPSSTAPVPTATMKPTEASVPAQDVQTATIRATVYVRAEPDANSPEIGSLTTGEVVEIVTCAGDWCQIEPEGWVWRGCLSDNPDGLKCEARP
jgi:multidrug efflux pump subunit AcrA (membrane-fusion protein)